VEKAKLRPFKEVMKAAICWIHGNLVPRSAASTRDNKELAVVLKAFIGVAVTAEK
jgi:hypothetical protein